MTALVPAFLVAVVQSAPAYKEKYVRKSESRSLNSRRTTANYYLSVFNEGFIVAFPKQLAWRNIACVKLLGEYHCETLWCLVRHVKLLLNDFLSPDHVFSILIFRRYLVCYAGEVNVTEAATLPVIPHRAILAILNRSLRYLSNYGAFIETKIWQLRAATANLEKKGRRLTEVGDFQEAFYKCHWMRKKGTKYQALVGYPSILGPSWCWGKARPTVFIQPFRI